MDPGTAGQRTPGLVLAVQIDRILSVFGAVVTS
jgi:hypothetical protein